MAHNTERVDIPCGNFSLEFSVEVDQLKFFFFTEEAIRFLFLLGTGANCHAFGAVLAP